MRRGLAAVSPKAICFPLEGERVLVDRLDCADGADRAAFLNAARESRELLAPWVALPATREELDAHLRRTEICLVRLARERTLAGGVEVNQVSRCGTGSACLGFYAFTAGHRQGLMSEAVRLVMAAAFAELELELLYAYVAPGNSRSSAFVSRLGFRFSGVWPKLLRDGSWRDYQRWTARRAGRPPVTAGQSGLLHERLWFAAWPPSAERHERRLDHALCSPSGVRRCRPVPRLARAAGGEPRWAQQLRRASASTCTS